MPMNLHQAGIAFALFATTVGSAYGQAGVTPQDSTSRVIVNGTDARARLSEDALVGPNEQPEWTTRRVFAETDVYVLPPGTFEYNQYYLSTHPRSGVPGNFFESEFELGLPFRSQFDVELDYSIHHGGKLRYDGTLLELPHAIAKWGVIPLNPTVDAGWRFITGAPDAFFFRLLLAEEFSKRIHSGADFTFDRQIGGDRETSFEFNQALSYVVINSKLSVGYEFRLEYEREQAEHESESEGGGTAAPAAGGSSGSGDDDDNDNDNDGGTTDMSLRHRGGRFEHSLSVLLGPSVLYRPTSSTYVSLVPLVGLTRQSASVEAYLIFGIEFGPRKPSKQNGGEEESERVPLPRGRR